MQIIKQIAVSICLIIHGTNAQASVPLYKHITIGEHHHDGCDTEGDVFTQNQRVADADQHGATFVVGGRTKQRMYLTKNFQMIGNSSYCLDEWVPFIVVTTQKSSANYPDYFHDATIALTQIIKHGSLLLQFEKITAIAFPQHSMKVDIDETLSAYLNDDLPQPPVPDNENFLASVSVQKVAEPMEKEHSHFIMLFNFSTYEIADNEFKYSLEVVHSFYYNSKPPLENGLFYYHRGSLDPMIVSLPPNKLPLETANQGLPFEFYKTVVAADGEAKYYQTTYTYYEQAQSYFGVQSIYCIQRDYVTGTGTDTQEALDQCVLGGDRNIDVNYDQPVPMIISQTMSTGLSPVVNWAFTIEQPATIPTYQYFTVDMIRYSPTSNRMFGISVPRNNLGEDQVLLSFADSVYLYWSISVGVSNTDFNEFRHSIVCTDPVFVIGLNLGNSIEGDTQYRKLYDVISTVWDFQSNTSGKAFLYFVESNSPNEDQPLIGTDTQFIRMIQIPGIFSFMCEKQDDTVVSVVKTIKWKSSGYLDFLTLSTPLNSEHSSSGLDFQGYKSARYGNLVYDDENPYANVFGIMPTERKAVSDSSYTLYGFSPIYAVNTNKFDNSQCDNIDMCLSPDSYFQSLNPSQRFIVIYQEYTELSLVDGSSNAGLGHLRYWHYNGTGTNPPQLDLSFPLTLPTEFDSTLKDCLTTNYTLGTLAEPSQIRGKDYWKEPLEAFTNNVIKNPEKLVDQLTCDDCDVDDCLKCPTVIAFRLSSQPGAYSMLNQFSPDLLINLTSIPDLTYALNFELYQMEETDYHTVFAIHMYFNFGWQTKTTPRTQFTTDFMQIVYRPEENQLILPDCKPYCNTSESSDYIMLDRLYKMKSDLENGTDVCYYPIKQEPKVTIYDFTATGNGNQIECPYDCGEEWDGYGYTLPPNITVFLELQNQPLTVDFRDNATFTGGLTKEHIKFQQLGWQNFTTTQPLSATLNTNGSWSFSSTSSLDTNFTTNLVFLLCMDRVGLPITNLYNPYLPNLVQPVYITVQAFNCSSYPLVHNQPADLVTITNSSGAQFIQYQISDIVFSAPYDANEKCNTYLISKRLTTYLTNVPLTQLPELIEINATHIIIDTTLPDLSTFSLSAYNNVTGSSETVDFIWEYTYLDTFTSEISSQLTNEGPVFDESPISALNLNLTRMLDGSFSGESDYTEGSATKSIQWDDDQFTYSSPTATDAENDVIFFSFSGQPSGYWLQPSEGSNFFKIKLDRYFIGSSFSGDFSITMSDSASTLSQTTVVVKINLVYSEEEEDSQAEASVYEELGEPNTTDADIAEQDEELEQLLSEIDQPVSQDLSADDQYRQHKEKQAMVKKLKATIKLKASGATKIEGIGYTFPGVDVAQFDKALQSSDEKPPNPPKMQVSMISSQGYMLIEFDQKMIAPSTIDQNFYNNVFVTTFVSDTKSDLSSTGQFRSSSANRQLQEGEANATFSMEVTKHEAKKIEILFNFEDPDLISTGMKKDQISIYITNPDVFVSLENQMTLSLEAWSTIKQVPRQMNPLVAGEITQSTRRSGNVLNGVAASNAVISIVLGGSMQQLWGMVRTLQMIILICLIEIQTPSHVFLFIQIAMEIAQFDLFDAEWIYNSMFVFKQTSSLNQNFEFFGVTDKNFMLNSGSFIPFLLAIFGGQLLGIVIQTIAKCGSRYHFMREVGVNTYKQGRFSTSKYASQKLFLECFFDLYLCLVLHYFGFFYDKQGGFIQSYFTHTDDIWLTIMVLIFLTLGTVFPLWAYLSIVRNFKNLKDPRVSENYQILLEDNRSATVPRALYVFFFIFRRFLSAITLVLLSRYPYIQIIIFLTMSILTLCYYSASTPLKQGNNIEIVNEACIYVCTLIIGNFLNAALPLELSNILGWFLIGLICSNILLNITLTVVQSITQLIKNTRDRRALGHVTKILNKNQENRDRIIYNFGSKAKYYVQQQDEDDAIKFTRKWTDHRKWLKDAKVDFKDFPEEVKYQQLVKSYNLKQRAQIQRLEKSVELLAKSKTFEKIEDQKIKNRLRKCKNRDYIREQLNRPGLNNPKRRNNVETMIDKSKVLKLAKIEETQREDEDSHPSVSEFEAKQKFIMYEQKFNDLLQDQRLQGLSKLGVLHHKGGHVKEKDHLAKIKKTAVKPEIVRTLMQIMDEEEDNKAATKALNYKQKNMLRQVQNEKNNLSFMLEVDTEEYDEEQALDLPDQRDLALQFHDNPGLDTLQNGGHNDCLQAVMQILVKLRPLAMFFMQKQYLKCNPDRSKLKLCELLYQFFIEMNGDKAAAVSSLIPSYNLNELMLYIDKNAEWRDADDASDVLVFLLLKMLDEMEVTLEEDPKISEQQLIRQSMTFSKTIRTVCEEGHIHSNDHQVVTHLKLPVCDTIEESFAKSFNSNHFLGPCWRCTDQNMKVHRLSILTDLPDVLFVIFDIFAPRFTTSTSINIPLQYDPIDHIPADSSDSQDSSSSESFHHHNHQVSTSFTLTAVVDCQGQSVKDSVYTAYIKRDGQKNFKSLNTNTKWYKIHKDSLEPVEEQVVLTEMRPHILVYERN